MKKIKISLALMVLLSVLLSSCTKEVTNSCTLSSIYINGNLHKRFFFTQDRLARIEQYDNATGILVATWTINWDNLGRLDYIDYLTASGVLYERQKITRNTDGNIGRVYIFTDNNNDMFPETMNGYTEYLYNGDQQIIEEQYYNPPSNYSFSEYYTWTNGNLVRKDNNVLGYVLYTYDDKKSINEKYKELFFVFYDPSVLSSNNVIIRSSFDTNDNLLSTGNFLFTYNADGYPVSESINQYSYEYNCNPE
jgi:hypothetical protein